MYAIRSYYATKLTVLETLSEKVDQLIVGGGIANTFLAASGKPVGKSLCEHDLADIHLHAGSRLLAAYIPDRQPQDDDRQEQNARDVEDLGHLQRVITSYSIHYTKLYEPSPSSCASPMRA